MKKFPLPILKDHLIIIGIVVSIVIIIVLLVVGLIPCEWIILGLKFPLPCTQSPGEILTIESISGPHPYGGEDDEAFRAGSADLITGPGPNPEYTLRYSLPQEGEGYAGLAFPFIPPQNLTDYEYIEVTIIFGDPEARCELVLEDKDKTAHYIRLDNIPTGTGITVNTYENRHTVLIPLSTNLGSVNREFLSQVGFNANAQFTRGEHFFIVSNIRFINK